MKKRIISALLALSMVVALPVGAVLADEVVQTDDVTVGQEYSVPETPVESNEDTAEDIVPEAPIEDNSEGLTGDVTSEDPTEETPADETEVSENEAENNLIATYADDTTYTYGDLTYKIVNNQITITDCIENVVSVDIPAEIDGIPVTSIGNWAFSFCKRLTSITIPDSVTSICSYAFANCTSLTSITIPDSVTYISEKAFGSDMTDIKVNNNNSNFSSEGGVLFNKNKTKLIRCPQKKYGEYTIPNTVTSIDQWAFTYCESLTSITISDSVTTIYSHVFSNCRGLTNITIPDSVTYIGVFTLRT